MTYWNTPILISFLVLTACDATIESPAPTPTAEAQIAGVWRAVLTSPGGELPFTLRIDATDGALSAVVLNGVEEAPFSSVDQEGSKIVLHFGWYGLRDHRESRRQR